MGVDMDKKLSKIEDEKKGNAVIALISSALPFPCVPGLVTQILNAKISALEEERVNLLFEGIKEYLQKLNMNIDEDFIKTKKFAVVFEAAYKTAINAKTEEKVQQIKNAFLYAIETGENYEESVDFFNIIDDIENIHVLILKRCWEQLLLARKLGSPTEPNTTLAGLVDFYKDIPRRTIERTCYHLMGVGLLENPTQGKYNSSNGVYTLTDYGVFFCEKIVDHHNEVT